MLAAYRISSCPRYPIHEPDTRLDENLLLQQALWSAVRFVILDNQARRVELRFASHKEDRSIRVSIIISGDPPLSDQEKRLLEHLVPQDYVLAKLQEEEWGSLEPSLSSGDEWKVSYLWRRLEFVDLPATFPWLVPQVGGFEEAPTSGVVGDEGGDPSRVNLASVFADMYENLGAQRTFPVPGIPFSIQRRTSRLCLPLLGEMGDLTPDRHRLLAEMQAFAPAVFSIVFEPVESKAVIEDRQSAAIFRRCLEPYRNALAGSGFVPLDRLDHVYNRYLLPPRHLCRLTMRVAAPEGETSLAIGHSLASYLGGVRAFEIDLMADGVTTLDQCLRHERAMRIWEFPPPEDGLWLGRLRRRLEAERIDYESDYAGLLCRMPHIYTLDEARHLMRLPVASEAGLPGITTHLVAPFYNTAVGYQPVGEPVAQDRLPIGIASSPRTGLPEESSNQKSASHWYHIPVDTLAKHALVVGTPGSGKSTFTTFLIRELARRGINFWVIEPVKTEYYDRLKPHVPNLVRRRLTENMHPDPASGYLTFDPMRLPSGIEVGRHISYLKSCFEAAFPMEEFLATMLDNGLHEYYQRVCKLRLSQRGDWTSHRVMGAESGRESGVYPSFATFNRWFIEHYIQKEINEVAPGFSQTIEGNNQLLMWKSIFNRRFKNLREGPIGRSFFYADKHLISPSKGVSTQEALRRAYNPLANLLNRNAVIELDAIPEAESKALVMSFLLTFLYEARQAEDRTLREKGIHSTSTGLKHVLILEEAHRLLGSVTSRRSQEMVGLNASGKAVAMFVDMLAEIRAYGQGIVIVEQIPSKIVSEAVKNTNLKIMLRLTSRDDRDYLGEAMHFDEPQKEFVTGLRTGQFVAFSDSHDQPTLLNLPDESTWDEILPESS